MKTWNYGNEIPKAVSYSRHLGVPVLTLSYNLQEVNNEDQGKYRWDSVTLEPGVVNYGSIVAAIINHEYGSDAMQAIINNYMLDPDDADAIATWNTMQLFRGYAKQIGRDFGAGKLDDADAPKSPFDAE